MKKIVIYGSVHGNAKKYASELARKFKMEAVPFKDVKDINEYDTVVYFGAVYAGNVLGLQKTLKRIINVSKKNILIVAVGMSDVNNVKNKDNIRKKIKKQLPEVVFNHSEIFHLRGGVDYSKLNFLHKTMMKFVRKKALNIPEEERTDEVKEFISSYGGKVSYIDYKSLRPIIKKIKE